MNELLPGGPHPLGANWDGRGTNFAVWAEQATKVELCLFSSDGAQETTRIALPRVTNGIFHGYLPHAGPGLRYGFRAYGPYAPSQGQRFNPHKLLLDPYARAIDRPARWHELLAGYEASDPDGSRPDARDSAKVAPRCVVIDPRFDWGDDAAPRTPLRDSLIYECHVKGLTALHPLIACGQRGSFAALGSEPVIAHLHSLGVTALELMPVHHGYSERFLIERGLSNYWNYNSVGFFAPDTRFSSSGTLGQQVHEFKAMVRALHQANLEVILDVVYNHSGETDELGPTLCLRGLGNACYYQLDPHDLRRYVDVTGCGNTLNLEHPQTLRLVADSLRYWVQEMHVDGFRFDLAPALSRGAHGLDVRQGLFAVIHQDPVLSRVKLIAEPWDLWGQARGEFLPGWSEWNDRYRDSVRRFFRGDRGQLGELATRVAGSADLFEKTRRTPQASVNFIAIHDGFTLRDLTSYERARNGPNGLAGNDGPRNNASRNWGAEGPSERAEVNAVRDRVARGMLATLATSLGVPMLLAGDEMGRTQDGNNNAYGHDSATSFVDWELAPRERALLEYTRQCFALRRSLGVFRRTEHYRGEPIPGSQHKDVIWFGADGHELAGADWDDDARSVLGMWICGHDMEGRPDTMRPSCVLLFNGGEEKVSFSLRRGPISGVFVVLLDSANSAAAGTTVVGAVVVAAHALCLLQSAAHGAAEP